MDEMLLSLETLLAPDAPPPKTHPRRRNCKAPCPPPHRRVPQRLLLGPRFVFIDPAHPRANCLASASPPTWVTQEFNSSANRYPAPPPKLGETRAKTKTRQVTAHLECLAAINALLTLGPSLRGRHLWLRLFIHDTWCLTSPVNGYAYRPDMARLSTILSLLKARLKIDAFSEHVPSKLTSPTSPADRRTEMIPLAASQ